MNCNLLECRTRLSPQDDHNAVYKLATSDSERALNTAELSKCVQRPATEVAEEMRKLILRLYGQFLSDDGSAVDYKGIGQSAAYKVRLCAAWSERLGSYLLWISRIATDFCPKICQKRNFLVILCLHIFQKSDSVILRTYAI